MKLTITELDRRDGDDVRIVVEDSDPSRRWVWVGKMVVSDDHETLTIIGPGDVEDVLDRYRPTD